MQGQLLKRLPKPLGRNLFDWYECSTCWTSYSAIIGKPPDCNGQTIYVCPYCTTDEDKQVATTLAKLNGGVVP